MKVGDEITAAPPGPSRRRERGVLERRARRMPSSSKRSRAWAADPERPDDKADHQPRRDFHRAGSGQGPITCANFERYVREGHFDATLFHRVIDGFMIQGVGMTTDLTEKVTHAPIRNEAKNGLKNLTGTVAMARTMEPPSASSQFFINVSDNAFLDYPGQDGCGLLCYLRPRDRRYGRGERHQGRQDRLPARPPGRAGAGCHHREGGDRRFMTARIASTAVPKYREHGNHFFAANGRQPTQIGRKRSAAEFSVGGCRLDVIRS